MRLYLSSVFESAIEYNKLPELIKDAHILYSYAYYNYKYDCILEKCKSVMMDSGAFTVMNSKIKGFNPKEYTRRYANFIKQHNIDLFMELDIEGVYGFDIYRDCLYMLQDITGKDPIYVFHKWRGIEYFKKLVEIKNYVALGDVNIAGKGGSKYIYNYFPCLIDYAHKHDCRVHGLAYTNISDLYYMGFDSVDSTSWKAGDRFANMSRFDGHMIQTYSCRRTETKKLDKSPVIQEHDFLEWKKLSQYFDAQFEPVEE